VLGPLLFLIYVNDLPNCSTTGEFIIYADDTNIIFTHKDKAKLLENINKEISHIANWFNCNKLSINTDKTNFMLFKDNNMNECSALAVKINGCTINRTNKVKFLGVEIQSDLSWNAHCNTKANKMSQSLAVLSKVKHLLPKSAMLSIYHSLIESHINYSILSWGKTCQRQINRVRTIQKRAVRIICKQRYNSHTDPLFRDLQLLKVDDIFKLACCKLYWKKIHDQLPAFHSSQLLTRLDIQQSERLTRQSDDITLFPIKTNLDKQTLNYNVSTTWNSLPLNIKNKKSLSINSFAHWVKKHFISSYNTTCNIQDCYVCNN
jgi:AraC-like DNA-binding protein